MRGWYQEGREGRGHPAPQTHRPRPPPLTISLPLPHTHRTRLVCARVHKHADHAGTCPVTSVHRTVTPPPAPPFPPHSLLQDMPMGAMPRLVAAALLVLALLALLAPGVQGATCDLEIASKLNRRQAKRGQQLTLTYRVRNTRASGVSPAFRVTFPPGVVLNKASTSKRGMGDFTNTSVQTTTPDDDPYTVLWPAAPIAQGKTRTFRLKLHVANCRVMPEAFLFAARAVENGTCMADVPVKEVAFKPTTYKGPSKWGRRHNTNTVCPVPFQLVQSGYKCNTTNDPTTFLGDRPSVDDCYSFCYYYGDTTPPSPFFFNYEQTTAGLSSCTCVGAVCANPIPAANAWVYQSLGGAPPPPGPVPTGPLPPVINAIITNDSIADGPLLPGARGVESGV